MDQFPISALIRHVGKTTVLLPSKPRLRPFSAGSASNKAFCLRRAILLARPLILANADFFVFVVPLEKVYAAVTRQASRE